VEHAPAPKFEYMSYAPLTLCGIKSIKEKNVKTKKTNIVFLNQLGVRNFIGLRLDIILYFDNIFL
jgi:hypothetical protein